MVYGGSLIYNRHCKNTCTNRRFKLLRSSSLVVGILSILLSSRYLKYKNMLR